VHHFAAVITLEHDHFFSHSGQVALWRLMASARAVFTVGPRIRPQEHEAEYMM
jgi:aspartyl/asparaginyl-tRNA synthetase